MKIDVCQDNIETIQTAQMKVLNRFRESLNRFRESQRVWWCDSQKIDM